MATTTILFGNNIRDLQEDGAAGIVTLAQLAGPRASRLLYTALPVVCVLALASMAAAGILPRPIVCAPVLLVLLWKPFTRVWRGERVADIDVQTARFETVLLLALLAVLLATNR